MNNGIFGRLDTEDNDVSVDVESNIVAELNAEEAYADALEIAASIDADSAAMVQAGVAAVRIETQISTEERIIATPEAVTASVVTLSQESLTTTAMLLGANASILGQALSTESIEANPVSALQISTEGAGDFLKKVIDSIKAIFKKVMNAAKKLFVKLVVAMDGTAKSAAKLLKVANGLTGDDKTDTFNEKQSKGMYKLFASQLALAGKETLDTSVVTDSMNTAAILSNQVPSVSDALSDAVAALDKATADAPNDKQRITKLTEAVAKINSGSKVSTKVEILESTFSYSKPDAKSGTLTTLISVVNPTSVKVVETYTEDKDDGSEKVRIVNLKVDSSVWDIDSKISVSSIQDIKDLAQLVVTNAKLIGKVKDTQMKVITNLNKDLDKLAKNTNGSYVINKLKANIATATRDVAVSIALDTVLSYVKNTKNALRFVKENVSMYSSSDM